MQCRNQVVTVVLALLGLVVVLLPVWATEIEWDGLTTDWQSGANWVGGAAPQSSEVARFNGLASGTAVNPALTSDAQVSGVVIANLTGNTSGRYASIGGSGYTLSIGADGFICDSYGVITVAPNIQLTADQTWLSANNTEGAITLNGTVSGTHQWTVRWNGMRDRSVTANASLSGFTGSLLLGTNEEQIARTASFMLNNTTGANMWNDDTPITVAQGDCFGLKGGQDETLGPLTVSGAGGVYVETANTILRLPSLSIDDGEVFYVKTTSADKANLGNNLRVVITAGAPTPQNGTLPGQYIWRRGKAGNDPDQIEGDFLTYGVNGFLLTTYNDGFDGGSNNEIANITVLTTVSAEETVEALRVAANVTLDADLLVNNGSVILKNANIVAGTGGRLILDAEGARGYLYSSQGDRIISAPVIALSGLSKTGPTALTLSSADSQYGSIMVNEGTLTIATDTTAGSVFTMNGGRVVRGASGGDNRGVAGIQGPGGLYLASGGGGTSFLITTADSTEYTYHGDFDVTRLKKYGTGAQRLTHSANRIQLSSEVFAGTLVWNGVNRDINTPSWTVYNGATLAGSGTVQGTSLTVEGGGILSPGDTNGTLTVDANLILQSGAVLQIDAAEDSDSIVVTGGNGLTLGDELNITVYDFDETYPSGSDLIIISGYANTPDTPGTVNISLPDGWLYDAFVVDGSSVRLTALTPPDQSAAGTIFFFR